MDGNVRIPLEAQSHLAVTGSADDQGLCGFGTLQDLHPSPTPNGFTSSTCPAGSPGAHSLLNIGLQHAVNSFVLLHRHVQRAQ